MQPTHLSTDYVVGPVVVRMTRFGCRSPICYEVPARDQTRLSIVLDEVGGIVQSRLDLRRYATSRAHVRREVAVLPPGVRAWMVSDGIAMLRCVSLLFDWSELSELTGTRCSSAPRLRLAEHDADMFQLARLLAATLEDRRSVTARAMGHDYVKALVSAIFARAVVALGSGSAPIRALRGAQLRAVMRALESHDRRPDIAKLAQDVGLSESHFYRAFKLATGETPYRWHLHARIRRAQVSLREPGAVIARVASEAGFADQSHFTRTFKELVGSTPRIWRRAARDPEP